MSRSYNNTYTHPEDAIKDGLITWASDEPCKICGIGTRYEATELTVRVCCDDCRVLAWQRHMKEQRSGHFKDYTFVLKNGTKKQFTEVRAWFAASDQGSFLYLEQLDVEGKPKSRWDLGDMNDILTGERLVDL